MSEVSILSVGVFLAVLVIVRGALQVWEILLRADERHRRE